MKKMRGVALVALALAVVTLFSACASGAKTLELGKLFDKNATYKSDALTLTKGEEVGGLAGKEAADCAAMLADFEKDGTHTIYNLDSAKVILTVEKPSEGDVQVTLNAFTLKGKEYGYITVLRTDEDGYKSTELYDATGAKVASAAYATSAKTVADMLYFDGKCYRFSADGMMGEAFAYSTLNDMPNIIAYNEKYYLAKEDYRYVVYDRLLLPVSAFDMPAYATVNVQTMLPDGDILVQYIYDLDASAKKYDYMYEKSVYADGNTDYTYKELTKANLVTLLVNPKNGKAKEISCDYFLVSARGVQMQDMESMGYKLGKIGVICYAYKIENERLNLTNDNRRYVSLDGNGKVSEYTVNGERVTQVSHVATGRYAVRTDEHTYLLDEKGKMVGDISNATIVGKHLLCDNKVYDMNLRLVTNLTEGGFSVYYTMKKALLLKNENGDYALYTENGDVTTIAGEKSAATLYDMFDEYVVVLREGHYVVISANGDEILTVQKEGALQRVYANDNAIIVSAPELVGDVYELTYYRLSA